MNEDVYVKSFKSISGGSQTIFNNWDSNARAGHPSRGLLQYIPSTFNSYKVSGHRKVLSVSRYKNTIVFNSESQGSFVFDTKTFTEFKGFFIELAHVIWHSFSPKKADSIASDYDSYYDKEFDNEGYLSLCYNGVFVTGPDENSNRLFRFNKRKAESFVFDFGRDQEQ